MPVSLKIEHLCCYLMLMRHHLGFVHRCYPSVAPGTMCSLLMPPYHISKTAGYGVLRLAEARSPSPCSIHHRPHTQIAEPLYFDFFPTLLSVCLHRKEVLRFSRRASTFGVNSISRASTFPSCLVLIFLVNLNTHRRRDQCWRITFLSLSDLPQPSCTADIW